MASRQDWLDYSIGLVVFRKHIEPSIGKRTVSLGRRVDYIYATLIGEVENALNILVGKASDFVHHSMYAEVATLPGTVLEHTYKENVYNGFYKNVRAFRANGSEILHPVGYIVILLNPEFQ